MTLFRLLTAVAALLLLISAWLYSERARYESILRELAQCNVVCSDTLIPNAIEPPWLMPGPRLAPSPTPLWKRPSDLFAARKVRAIEIDPDRPSGDVLPVLEKLSHLEYVRISGGYEETALAAFSAVLKSVSARPTLRYLHVKSAELTDELTTAITSNRSIWCIDLLDCSLTDAGRAMVAKMENLEALDSGESPTSKASLIRFPV